MTTPYHWNAGEERHVPEVPEGTFDQERRRFANRPTVVSPEMHYGLVRRVDSLENRLGSTERLVQEVANSQKVLHSHITGWFKAMSEDVNVIRRSTVLTRWVIAVLAVALLVYGGVMVVFISKL